ncbi:MAG: hypothetical protein ABMB14_03880 [Myxococcota bacterium]
MKAPRHPMIAAWIAAWLVALLTGCGTETGNPNLLFLGYNARTSDPTAVALDGDPGPVEVDTVWLRLGPVSITGDCDVDAVVETFDGLGFADHADPAPVVQQLSLDADAACAVATSFDVDPTATGEPADIAGTAVGITGLLDDGRAFVVAIDQPIALSFTLADEAVPEDGEWLMSFDVATWLGGAVSTALDGDPAVVSADSNAAAYATIVDQLGEGTQLHLDADEDGQVDPGERRLDR